MQPKEIKRDFPIFEEREELAYLDNAATSQKPRKVLESVKNFYSQKNANVGRGLYDLAGEATESYEQARSKVADFIGASTDELIFLRNTTEAENLLAESLEFEGDIVLSKMAHHSEQLPWRRKAEKSDKEIRYLETRNGKISLKSAEQEIGPETGLVAVSQVSNVFGTENPVEELIEIAHENNALVMVDCAQSVPHMPVDVKDMDADFVCFSGHKMLAPSGIGALYGKRELLEEMKPYQVGGGMISKVTEQEVSFESPPERFEAGTPNIAGAVGLASAVEYLEETGMEDIEQHDRNLSQRIHDRLSDIEQVNLISPRDAMLVSFSVEGIHSHDLAEVLNSEGVAVRAGKHCAHPLMNELGITGTVRASPYLYNTEEDVEKLVEGVKKALEVFE